MAGNVTQVSAEEGWLCFPWAGNPKGATCCAQYLILISLDFFWWVVVLGGPSVSQSRPKVPEIVGSGVLDGNLGWATDVRSRGGSDLAGMYQRTQGRRKREARGDEKGETVSYQSSKPSLVPSHQQEDSSKVLTANGISRISRKGVS